MLCCLVHEASPSVWIQSELKLLRPWCSLKGSRPSVVKVCAVPALPLCPQVLDLRGNPLHDEGAKMLCEVIRSWRGKRVTRCEV